MTTAAISTPRPIRRLVLTGRLTTHALTAIAAISVSLAMALGLASLAPAASFAVTPFGGFEPIRIAHVGAIEVDLQPGNPRRLRWLPCVAAAAGTTCFIPASRLSRLAEELPEAAELDLNPVIAGPDGCVAVDACIRIARPREAAGPKTW